jgi:hypothetical protein
MTSVSGQVRKAAGALLIRHSAPCSGKAVLRKVPEGVNMQIVADRDERPRYLDA